MRLSLVSETYPPEVNGVALTVQGLELGLRRLGHDVELIRPRQPDDPAESPDGQCLLPSAPVPRYPGLRFGLPAGRRLAALWHDARPDAIYIATEGPLGWSALRTARRLAIPVCTGLHTRFDDYIGEYAFGYLRPLVFAWMRRFHNHAATTLVPTPALADFLHGRGFASVTVLERAVDTALFDPARRDPELRRQWQLGPDDLAVVHVGRIAAEKNLPLAVRTFRAIQAKRPDARFVWIGDGPERAALARANPDFLMLGIKRGEDLARHFASADLFLFPSKSETFGNVTLEAMASGLATVAFDYGAAHEHLRDGLHGATLALDDDDGFVTRACRIATAEPQTRAAMAAAARAAVSPLSPDRVVQRFADLLSDLASHGRSHQANRCAA
ncbi:MAG TPA: glycosyl transferase [Xanthomonadales bacterium]|nr:glycosyl transferase [Xanthomonadales bacterium]